jgi:hypothetical protein
MKIAVNNRFTDWYHLVLFVSPLAAGARTVELGHSLAKYVTTEPQRHRENLKSELARARESCLSDRDFELTEVGEPTEKGAGASRFRRACLHKVRS